jgi:hypothetical protein
MSTNPGPIRINSLPVLIQAAFYIEELISKLSLFHNCTNEEEWIVTNIFLRFFENSSDELGTGNTRHLRKSIVIEIRTHNVSGDRH